MTSGPHLPRAHGGSSSLLPRPAGQGCCQGDTGVVSQPVAWASDAASSVAFVLKRSLLPSRELLSSDAMKEYNRARVYLDENFKSQEHFTVSALPRPWVGAGPTARLWELPLSDEVDTEGPSLWQHTRPSLS